MKISIAYLCLLLSVILVSCDKITQAPDLTNVKPNSRKILLEDYTGHQCGNCPPAAGVAEGLSEKYGDKVVVIAVHAGWWTKLNTEFTASYTCQTGNDWDAASGFGVGSAGNPNGMINRKYFGGDRIIYHTKWSTNASLASRDIEFCDMNLNASYNPANRKLNTTIKTKFRRSYPNNTKLCVAFTEDSIVGPQRSYFVGQPDVIHNYVFMHVLRGSINGSWGADLKAAPIKYQDSVIVSYPNFALDTKFVDKNVTVIAFVYDAISKEVLQVEKVKIRN